MFCTFFLANSVRLRTPCWNLSILPPNLASSPLLFVIFYFSTRPPSLGGSVPQGEAGPGLCRLPCQRRGTPPYSEHPVRTRCPGDKQRTAITARNHAGRTAQRSRQVCREAGLQAGALGPPWGCGGEGGGGFRMGTHAHPRLIHVSVGQNHYNSVR